MNNYILLNGKKYTTLSGAWAPITLKPATVRPTLLGTVDATYGPAALQTWEGIVEGPNTVPDSSWGTYSDLVAAINTMGEVSFTDHYGNAMYVHITGQVKHDSMTPLWDGPSNIFRVAVKITKGRNA